jgi:uncharacterized protein (UPF0147 family)
MAQIDTPIQTVTEEIIDHAAVPKNLRKQLD